MHAWGHAPASTHPEGVGRSGEKRRKDGQREGETEILGAMAPKCESWGKDLVTAALEGGVR